MKDRQFVLPNHLLTHTLAPALNAIAIISVMMSTTAFAAQPVLAPHRAVYDMSLEKAGSGAGVSALTGRMVFELKGNACSGYQQSMRFVTETMDQNGKPSITDQRSTFFENVEQQKLKFVTDEFRNDRLAEKTEGQAIRSSKRDELRVNMRSPKKKDLKFDRSVMFPVEHSIKLLEAAQAGDRLFTVDLYDGSDKGEKVYATTAALGEKLPPGVNARLTKVDSAKSLDALGAWPVSLSYFDVETVGKKRDAVPNYELSFLYFENGVSRKLFIDYGSFSMRGELVKLKMLPTKPCQK